MTNVGTNASDLGYAGDVTVAQAWKMLDENPGAVLVDVRTTAEWAYVGLPDLAKLGKSCQTISWVQFPAMAPNPNFLAELKNIQRDTSAPVLFLCRSGVRSIAAAIASTGAGFTNSYNILEGFEGNHDADRHRGSLGGWKVAGLDWVQN
ncbi:MAG: rhodanese-like domain-containing protein [Sneathiella sp.]|nr:rhodanese-like domain-containing protein [Sneathiella sp.]